MYGRFTIDRYDEWQVCRDGGRVVSASRTGNVMYKTRVHYFRVDSTGRVRGFFERVDRNMLNSVLELRNYYKPLTTIAADVSRPSEKPVVISIGEVVANNFRTQCSNLQPSIGAPVGIVAAIVKGLNYIKSNPFLLAIPLSFDIDFRDFAGVEYKVDYENLGASTGEGYDVVEYVDIYANSERVKVENNCVVDLPLSLVISR